MVTTKDRDESHNSGYKDCFDQVSLEPTTSVKSVCDESHSSSYKDTCSQKSPTEPVKFCNSFKELLYLKELKKPQPQRCLSN